MSTKRGFKAGLKKDKKLPQSSGSSSEEISNLLPGGNNKVNVDENSMAEKMMRSKDETSSESEWSSPENPENDDQRHGVKDAHKASTYRPSVNSSKMNLLKDMSCDPHKIPEKINKPSPQYMIPKPRLVRLLMFEAKIIHFENFDNFYVHKVASKTDDEHSKLYKQMQCHYNLASRPFENKVFQGFICAVCEDGVWRRGIVKHVKETQAEVFLVDVGKTMTMDKDKIMPLKPQHMKEPSAGAIKCCLADVRPTKENKMMYPEKVIKEFKKIVTNPNFTVQILPKEISSDDAPSPAVVYVFPGNGWRVNLNAMLVERMKCAESAGKDSIEVIEIDPYAEPQDLPVIPKTKPKKSEAKIHVAIEMLYIISPNEFYGVLKHRKDEIDKAYLATQSAGSLKEKYRRLQQADPKKDWNDGEHCLVSLRNDKADAPEFFRAFVVKSVEPSTFDVVLIDQGLHYIVEPDQMFETLHDLQNAPPAAFRMHIPGALPTGASSWTLSSLDAFKRALCCFKSLCVSVVGEKNEEGSLPVLIYGVVIEESPFVQQSRLNNIANHLYLEGYLDSLQINYQELVKVERPISDKDFGWNNSDDTNESLSTDECSLPTKSDDASSDNMTLGDVTIEVIPRSITSWVLPSSDETFIGIPTNVDENGIIYIHSEKQDQILEDMKTMITSIYSKFPPEDENELKVGQPVIVFHIFDICFYRAQLESLSNAKKLYKVKFVDYGTIEYVRREDIFSKVVASSIPIMTKRYRLSSIVPLPNDDNEWPMTTLDFIHGKIVDNKAEISVTTQLDDVFECSINIFDEHQNPTIAIEKLLIEMQLAKKRETDDAWPPMKKKLPEKKLGWDRDEVQRYKQEMEQKSMEELMNKFIKPLVVVASPEETKEYIKKQDEDLNRDIGRSLLAFKYSHTGIVRRPVLRAAPSEPQEARYSLKYPRRSVIRLTPQIEFFELQLNDIKDFMCTYANIVDEKIFLLPDIPELTKRKLQMEKVLAQIDDSLLVRFKRLDKIETKLCLANNGTGWKRGNVVKLLEHGKAVEVLLVDTGKTDIFEVDQVRKLVDKKLIGFPRQALAVVLNGFQLNQKFRNPELIYLQFAHDLEAKPIRAVVKGYDDKDYPQVDLFFKDGKLAYQKLIDKNYFVKC